MLISTQTPSLRTLPHHPRPDATGIDRVDAGPQDSFTLSAVGKLPEGEVVTWMDSGKTALKAMAFAAPAAFGGAVGGAGLLPGFLATTAGGVWALDGNGVDDVQTVFATFLSLAGSTALTAAGAAGGWRGAALISAGVGLAAGWMNRPGRS